MRRWQVIEGLVSQNGWTTGVEVGVFRGETFRHLLRTCPALHLTGVDRFDTAYFQSTREGRPPKAFDLEREFSDLIAWADLKAQGRGDLLQCDSAAAALTFADGAFDFVFIDADHRYEAVARDIAAWRGKVRQGGMLLGHDWNAQEFPGVVRAVREAFPTYRIQTYDDHVWGVAC